GGAAEPAGRGARHARHGGLWGGRDGRARPRARRLEDRGFLMPDRIARVERKTAETSIVVRINLDGTGQSRIDTPLPFLSHMLDQIARHGLFDLEVEATGDVEIDGHHTTEDLGIVLGKAVLQALGDRKGIQRYGAATLPMDEALVRVA